MIFTAIVMLILAFMGMILFDTKILFGILMLLCAGGLLANELVLQKKITKKPIRVLIIGGLVAVFGICAILPGSRMTARSADDTPSTVEGDTFSEEDEGRNEYVGGFYEEDLEKSRKYHPCICDGVPEFARVHVSGQNGEGSFRYGSPLPCGSFGQA